MTFGSFVFPDLNLVLTIGGAVLGTIMTIVVPVMFYNRAYSDSFQPNDHDVDGAQDPEQVGLLGGADPDGVLAGKDPELRLSAPGAKSRRPDPRRTIKLLNYVVLTSGLFVSSVGFVNGI
jgi:hypothetical protein